MPVITALGPGELVANQTMFQRTYGCGNEQINEPDNFRKIISA